MKMKLLKRRMTAFLTLVFLLTATCLSGCNVDPDDKSVLVLKADPNNQTRNTAEATTGKQSETENGTGKAEAETTLTASATTATNGTNTTGAAKKDNVTVGKATEGTAQATKATRKPTTATTTKPSGTLTATQAKSIAEDCIKHYVKYRELGFFCDYEHVSDGDISKFLSPDQEKGYDNYRITCCHSIKEVEKHVARCLDKSLIDRKANNRNFCNDDKNNLYYTDFSLSIDNEYGDIALLKYSDNMITAKATVILLDSHDYGDYAYNIFTLKKENGNWVIIGIEGSDY